MPELIPVVFVLMFFGVIALGIFGAIQAAKRKKELHAWAAAKGLAVAAGNQRGYDQRYPRFEVLRQGSNRYAYNQLSGQWNGRAVLCFDYHYQTTSTDSKGRRKTHHHHFSAVILDHGLPLRPLFIRPEGLLDKFGAFFGLDDINFELDAFNRTFHVKCADRAFAFDVIHQATMDFMLAAPRFTLDFETHGVCIYKGGMFGPAEFEAAIGLAEGILDRLPDYLLHELKGAR